MPPILLIVVLLFPALVAAQVQVEPPADWIELEVPSELPPGTTYLKKVASGDQSIQVSVAVMKGFDTASGVEEFVAGQISGLKKGGFILESVADTTIDGFPAKHIVGEFRSDQYEGAYLADIRSLFSEQETVMISVSIDDSRGGRELGEGVLSWIKISGSPATFDGRPSEPSRNFSIGERIGRYAVYAVIVSFIIGIVRRRTQAAKAAKANSPS